MNPRACVALLALWLLTQPASARGDEQCSFGEPGKTEGCYTPRDGVLSSAYVALDAGYTTADTQARRAVHLGGVRPVEFRLGVALWDHLVVQLGIGRMGFKDYAPISEKVVRCETFQGVVTRCDDDVKSERSDVSARFLAYDVGVQHRFRPHPKLSITPGVTFGYLHSPRGVLREVHCKGCPGGRVLDLDIDGLACTPYLRFTMGPYGMLGLVVRSRWFVSGDLVQQTTLGVEFGLP